MGLLAGVDEHVLGVVFAGTEGFLAMAALVGRLRAAGRTRLLAWLLPAMQGTRHHSVGAQLHYVAGAGFLLLWLLLLHTIKALGHPARLGQMELKDVCGAGGRVGTADLSLELPLDAQRGDKV